MAGNYTQALLGLSGSPEVLVGEHTPAWCCLCLISLRLPIIPAGCVRGVGAPWHHAFSIPLWSCYPHMYLNPFWTCFCSPSSSSHYLLFEDRSLY